MRPSTVREVFSISAPGAARLLGCSPTVVAYLVSTGLVRAVVAMRPWPTWSGVRLDERALRAVPPGELARARARAPQFRVATVAEASALGMVLRAVPPERARRSGRPGRRARRGSVPPAALAGRDGGE